MELTAQWGGGQLGHTKLVLAGVSTKIWLDMPCFLCDYRCHEAVSLS